MDASCTKKRPLDPSVINDQILDLFAGQTLTTLIFEKDYLELKSEVGYWKAMHEARMHLLRGSCFDHCSHAPESDSKRLYGNSIWEALLLTKFLYCQLTNRLLNQYAELGLPISPGTVTGGLKTLMPLFNPVCDAFNRQQMTEKRFHNDESSWNVFEHVEGKIGNKWWLWVSRSESVVFFQITPGRGADVPVEYFGNTQRKKIIVICDRFSAYKSLGKQLPCIILVKRCHSMSCMDSLLKKWNKWLRNEMHP